MKPEPITVTVEIAGGKTISFETGKLAKQAHGSAVVRLGENTVLATAVANPEPRPASIFSRLRWTTANTPMPADVSPADLSSAKAV